VKEGSSLGIALLIACLSFELVGSFPVELFELFGLHNKHESSKSQTASHKSNHSQVIHQQQQQQ
jgi:hypothetical protein